MLEMVDLYVPVDHCLMLYCNLMVVMPELGFGIGEKAVVGEDGGVSTCG